MRIFPVDAQTEEDAAAEQDEAENEQAEDSEEAEEEMAQAQNYRAKSFWYKSPVSSKQLTAGEGKEPEHDGQEPNSPTATLDGDKNEVVIYAHVGGATGLTSSDWDHRPDAYVLVELVEYRRQAGATEELTKKELGRTAIMKNNHSPVWNEHFEIRTRPVDARRQVLRFSVWDWDGESDGKDDFIGQYEVGPGKTW